MRTFVAPCSHQYLVLGDLLIFASLVNVGFLSIVRIYISLLTDKGEHVFICLLAIKIFSFVKSPF